jgi:tripartite-type tricarboxylate transporter receptor subunit TctC
MLQGKKHQMIFRSRYRHLAILPSTALLLAGAWAAASQAQGNYPDHSVKLVVGFAAGGNTDVAARIIARKLTEVMGQTFVVENRGGASGLIAADQVAKSPADGYTLMASSQTALSIAPALYRKLQIDVPKEFTGLTMIGISPLVVVVRGDSPIKSIEDLIAEAKAKNGTMNYCSGGVGTPPHIAGELFAFKMGIKIIHVGYRGEAPCLNDLLAGQIPFMFASAQLVMGNVQAGKLRALATGNTDRLPWLSDVPAIAEKVPGFEAAAWVALVAPAATPHDIVAKVNAEARKIIATKDYQERLDKIGMVVGQDFTSDQLNAYIKAESAKWTKVIQDVGVSPVD